MAEPCLALVSEEEDAGEADVRGAEGGAGGGVRDGDNRDRSFDSRFERYEPVRLSDVFGKYRYTYWHAAVGAK